MSFILSANRDRDSIEEARKNWDDYQAHLEALRDRFPVSAFEIATSDWWYQFDLPGAPHDSRLIRSYPKTSLMRSRAHVRFTKP
jgi:hypothetical protein